MKPKRISVWLVCLGAGAMGWVGCGQKIAGDEHQFPSAVTPAVQMDLGAEAAWDSSHHEAPNSTLTLGRVDEDSEYEKIERASDQIRIICWGRILDQTVPGGLPTLFFEAGTKAEGFYGPVPISYIGVSAEAEWAPYGSGNFQPLWQGSRHERWHPEVSVDFQASKKFAWTGRLNARHTWQVTHRGTAYAWDGPTLSRTAFFLESMVAP